MHYTIRYETLYVFFRYVEKEKKTNLINLNLYKLFIDKQAKHYLF